jgi:hypothetical protein
MLQSFGRGTEERSFKMMMGEAFYQVGFRCGHGKKLVRDSLKETRDNLYDQMTDFSGVQFCGIA